MATTGSAARGSQQAGRTPQTLRVCKEEVEACSLRAPRRHIWTLHPTRRQILTNSQSRSPLRSLLATLLASFACKVRVQGKGGPAGKRCRVLHERHVLLRTRIRSWRPSHRCTVEQRCLRTTARTYFACPRPSSLRVTAGGWMTGGARRGGGRQKSRRGREEATSRPPRSILANLGRGGTKRAWLGSIQR